jgi:protein phosphatase
LCTDGLHNFVSEDRITEVLATQPDREACLQTLVEDAHAGGGGDNITIALAWVDARPTGKTTRLDGAVVEGPDGLRAQVQS